MRPDQLASLDDLTERLADVFITEVDPVNWSGDGKLPADRSKEERGNRSWDIKGAMSVGGALTYVLNIKRAALERTVNAHAEQAERDSDLDRQINDAERRAEAAVKRVLKKASAPGGKVLK